MPEPVSSSRKGAPADPHTNIVVKFVLRSGLSSALVLLLAGLVVELVQARHVAVDVRMFDILGAPNVGQVLMGFGVLVLTLTPVAGILSVLVSWLHERDRGFALVGFVVVVVLLAAVLVGLAG